MQTTSSWKTPQLVRSILVLAVVLSVFGVTEGAAPLQDTRDASAATLRTVSPNGGERWEIGTTRIIRWAYSGDLASVGRGVTIELLKGDKVVYTVPPSIMIGARGTGYFRWTIPSLVPDSNYKIRVVSSTKVSDLSDQSFTLVGSRIVVSSSLEISGDGETRLGMPLRGGFTITNRGNTEAVLNRVLIGGLFSGKCLNTCPDFKPLTGKTRLAPGHSYRYSGLFVPLRVGTYTFSVAVQKSTGRWEKPVEADDGKVNQLDVKVLSLTGKAEKRGSALVKWFENETNDDKRIPLILIHGIHGSDDLDAITDKGREDKRYWKIFLNRFTSDERLKETYSLYVFQYYSDKDGVQDLARQLGKSIDDRLPDRPHVLLAHSMGGLVAKSYMVDYRHTQGAWSGTSGGDSTILLITLATPHHGTPGANDADAIDEYMDDDDWRDVFDSVSFLYWGSHAGWFSAPRRSSDAFNRSDLRWDNYDNAITEDANSWLGGANEGFKGYSSKVIVYAGALRTSDLTAGRAKLKLLGMARASDHQRLAFLNNTMVHGLSRRFGVTDGMVPYKSAALCDPGPFLIDAANRTFLCSSPTRVRRFEPGESGSLTVDEQTLSITRRPDGYNHLDMLAHGDVLDWVFKDLDIGPNPRVSVSLNLAPASNYQVGQVIDGSFSITNRGKTDLIMKQMTIGGRLGGICPNNQCPDFGPRPADITLRPNETYNYAGKFTPAQAGLYTFYVAYENTEGKWTMPVQAENNNKNKLSITVTENKPNVVVSRSLTLIPGRGPFPLGQTFDGSFNITNRGNAPLTMRQVIIGGRVGGNCPNNVCPDFSPISSAVTLGPGETFSYSGKITLNQQGSYIFYVAYQTPDGKWEMPVKPERGAVNQVSVVVQPPGPVLTRVSPSAIAASSNAQSVNLHGVRLSKVLYAQLRLPNGRITYLYIPLNQVINVNDEEVRISAKFPGGGTHYITVWTADGKSNEYPITVH